MVTITPERASDVAAREGLLDRAFGRNRRRKTSQRLRDGRLPARGLAFAARSEHGALIGTLRLWHVKAGPKVSALLLGPLAVDNHARGQGIGSKLMEHAIAEAKRLGHRAVLLVGDEPYYSRFGFKVFPTGGLQMPGPVDPNRFLALELVPGALSGAQGLIVATGERELGRHGGLAAKVAALGKRAVASRLASPVPAGA